VVRRNFSLPLVRVNVVDGMLRLREVVAPVILRHIRQWHIAVYSRETLEKLVFVIFENCLKYQREC